MLPEKDRQRIIKKAGVRGLEVALDRYMVSSLGRVKRKTFYAEGWHGGLIPFHETIMTGCPDKRGYLGVNVSFSGKTVPFLVHRLVGFAFIPNPDELPEIDHKNEVRNDNRVGNLQWVTGGDNIHLRFERKSDSLHGSTNPHSKLTESDVVIIKQRLMDGHTHRAIAKDFGVHRSAVTLINRGKQWKHVTVTGWDSSRMNPNRSIYA